MIIHQITLPKKQDAEALVKFMQEGANIYRGTGNVGIGTSKPATKLEVNTASGSYVFRTCLTLRSRHTAAVLPMENPEGS
jgi:hypothetical protein